jgi:hypothetical protein
MTRAGPHAHLTPWRVAPPPSFRASTYFRPCHAARSGTFLIASASTTPRLCSYTCLTWNILARLANRSSLTASASELPVAFPKAAESASMFWKRLRGVEGREPGNRRHSSFPTASNAPTAEPSASLRSPSTISESRSPSSRESIVSLNWRQPRGRTPPTSSSWTVIGRTAHHSTGASAEPVGQEPEVISHGLKEPFVERFETVDVHIGDVNAVIRLGRRLIPSGADLRPGDPPRLGHEGGVRPAHAWGLDADHRPVRLETTLNLA